MHVFCYADDKERWQRLEYTNLNLRTMQRPGVPESKIVQSVDDAGMWNTMVECFNKGYLLALCSEGIAGSNPVQGVRLPSSLCTLRVTHFCVRIAPIPACLRAASPASQRQSARAMQRPAARGDAVEPPLEHTSPLRARPFPLRRPPPALSQAGRTTAICSRSSSSTR